jgi:hypothetical protein
MITIALPFKPEGLWRGGPGGGPGANEELGDQISDG